jgi:hypothetical protein
MKGARERERERERELRDEGSEGEESHIRTLEANGEVLSCGRQISFVLL